MEPFEKACLSGEDTMIYREGEPVAVIVDFDRYQRLKSRLSALSGEQITD